MVACRSRCSLLRLAGCSWAAFELTSARLLCALLSLGAGLLGLLRLLCLLRVLCLQQLQVTPQVRQHAAPQRAAVCKRQLPVQLCQLCQPQPQCLNIGGLVEEQLAQLGERQLPLRLLRLPRCGIGGRRNGTRWRRSCHEGGKGAVLGNQLRGGLLLLLLLLWLRLLGRCLLLLRRLCRWLLGSCRMLLRWRCRCRMLLLLK